MAHNEVTTFSTPRLRAERLCEGHAAYLADLHTDTDVMAKIGGIRNAEQSETWLRKNLECWEVNGFGQWMLRDLAGELVGRGGLRWIDPCVGERVVELGCVLQHTGSSA
jgi:ribosomal-protein-alanine N-acetyltransferase